MKAFFQELSILLSYPKNLVLLGVRLVVAYGFSVPALTKMNDPEGAMTWFASLGIPFPTLMAYTVAGIESTGVVLLVLGLFAYNYHDINTANNQLLVEIRKQNSDLKRLLCGITGKS